MAGAQVEHEWLERWLDAAPWPVRQWWDAHPDALSLLGAFGEQGFDDTWALICLTLPEACASRTCDCR